MHYRNSIQRLFNSDLDFESFLIWAILDASKRPCYFVMIRWIQTTYRRYLFCGPHNILLKLPLKSTGTTPFYCVENFCYFIYSSKIRREAKTKFDCLFLVCCDIFAAVKKVFDMLLAFSATWVKLVNIDLLNQTAIIKSTINIQRWLTLDISIPLVHMMSTRSMRGAHYRWFYR